MKKLILISVATLLAISACQKTELIEIVKLGAVEKTLYLPLEPGADTIDVLTFANYSVETYSGGEWLTMRNDGLQPSTRNKLPFRFAANNGYCRMAKVVLSQAERRDTVYLKQEGPLKESVSLSEHALNVPAEGGTFEIKSEIYLPSNDLHIFVSSEKAITSVVFEQGFLKVKFAPSTHKDSRIYTVRLYYINGWEEEVSDAVVFTQAPII